MKDESGNAPLRKSRNLRALSVEEMRLAELGCIATFNKSLKEVLESGGVTPMGWSAAVALGKSLDSRGETAESIRADIASGAVPVRALPMATDP